MKKVTLTLATLVLLVSTSALLSGCNPQARGFALPPGDAAAGKQTFISLGCSACHSVEGHIARTTASTGAPKAQAELPDVTLGGELTRVKTYGDLVTSIINPSHKLSRGNSPETVMDDGTSRMPTYNSVMTVEQLLDLTSFLQEAYTVWVPEYGPYYFP